MKKLRMSLAALTLLCGSSGIAQSTDFDARRHFFFYMPNSERSVVLADLSSCAEQAKEAISFDTKINTGSSGIIQGVIQGIMRGKDSRDMHSAIMRRCMAFYGYERYAMSEVEWKALVGEGDMVVTKEGQINTDALNKFADKASGSAPTSQRLGQ